MAPFLTGVPGSQRRETLIFFGNSWPNPDEFDHGFGIG
jgi:hypothetical protein